MLLGIGSTCTELNAGVGTPMASVTLVRTISFGLYQRSKHVIDHYMTQMTGQSPLDLANQKGQYPTLSTITCFSSAGATAGAVITFISCMFISTVISNDY